MARDCPLKGKAPIKAIEDGSLSAITASALNGFFAVDHEGFRPVRGERHAKQKAPGRPMPTRATLGDFISKNSFADLQDKDDTTTTPGTRDSTAPLAHDTAVHSSSKTGNVAPPPTPTAPRPRKATVPGAREMRSL